MSLLLAIINLVAIINYYYHIIYQLLLSTINYYQLRFKSIETQSW